MNKEVIDVLKNMQQEMNNASGGLFERLKNIEIENGNLKQENKQLKDVIEEVREYIEDWLFNAGGNGASMSYEDINELLQILDKAKGEMNNE